MQICLYNFPYMRMSETVSWKLLLNQWVHAYFSVIHRKQEANPKEKTTPS